MANDKTVDSPVRLPSKFYNKMLDPSTDWSSKKFSHGYFKEQVELEYKAVEKIKR